MWRLVLRFIRERDEINPENKGIYENYLRDSLHIVFGVNLENSKLWGIII